MNFKIKILIFFSLIIFVGLWMNFNANVIYADELKDNINQQLENIDLSELENYFNDTVSVGVNIDFFSYVNKIFNGEYDFEFNTFYTYIINILKDNVKNILPIFIEIFIIALICGILQKLKSSMISNSVGELILFVGLLSVVLILSGQIISIWKNVKIVIENIAKLTEIMSPIILTLMVASGGNVSATVYKPAVVFLSSGIINIILTIVLPLIALMII